MRHLILLAMGLALIASPGEAQPQPDHWWTRYKEGSQQVTIPGGRQMTLYCEGSGAPLVVLDSGLGDGAPAWRKVQGQIAAFTRVCAYDRAGIGGSAPGPLPRSTEAIVSDLEALLKAARLPGPYVLVGHSMGSFDVRMYASRNLPKVAGIVLVDPSADEQNARMAAVMPRMIEIQNSSYAPLERCARLAAGGELTPDTKGCTQPPPPDVPPELRDWVRGRSGANAVIARKSELDAFMTLDAAQMAKVRQPLGAMPLIVLTGKPTAPGMTPEETDTLFKLWNGMHDELAALSTAGENRIVPGASHYIQYERPGVVGGAVREVVDKVRAARR
jgi:pimeloyl-ACP methyl ester carboxylesterase